ncbi:acyltransferase family protein [Floccifex sp.]|uniref:acyltransferase family protein n=1 Tax=Floccifex sp. TaxID=2815810 RepID=UPI003F0A8ECD
MEDNRDYFMDNYKALLIVLVVISHFLELNNKNNLFLYLLKWFIVCFHMPAFIFVSGYFSKKELSIEKLIKKLFIPYLVYEIIYYFFYTFILHRTTKLYLLKPKFSLWYLLALFVWRLITPYFKKIPHYMIVSVSLGLLIGISDMQDNFLSIPRILYFYPFFLFGTITQQVDIKKLLSKIKIKKIIPVFLIVLLISFVICPYSNKIFYGRYNYESLHQTDIEGMFVRLLCYAIGFLMIIIMMFFVKKDKTSYSYIGQRTMPVYIFHGLTYCFFKYNTTILQMVNTPIESMLLILFCLLLVKLYSSKIFFNITNYISNIHLPIFSHQR